MDPNLVVAENLRRIRAARGFRSPTSPAAPRRQGDARRARGGRGNPTVGTLAAVADELGVALDQLVSEPRRRRSTSGAPATAR